MTGAPPTAGHRKGSSSPAAVLVAVVGTLSAFTAWWWSAYRRGMPWFIDEAGYLTFAIDHAHAIRDDGAAAVLFDHIDGPYGPLMPAASGTGLAIVDHPYGVALATMIISGASLVLASWFLARRLTTMWWAVLAATVVGTCPIVLALTGVYYFAVPAAALYTFALACLVRGEHGDRVGWCIAGGISLGLATLARTMVLGLAPAVVVVAVWGACRRAEGRARRLATLALSGVAGLLVMSPWWIPNLGTVLDYLDQPARSGRGLGGGSRGRPWQVTGMRDLRLLISDLLLPTSVVLLILALVSLLVWWRRGAPRGPRSIAALTLTGVVALSLGVLAAAREAVGQWLPLLPAMVVLAVTGLSQVGGRRARQLGVGVLCSLVGFNLAVASRTIPSLSEPRFVTVGPVGRVSMTDGRWLLEEQRPRSELSAGGRLPRSYESVQEGVERIVLRAASRAAAAHEPAVLVAPRSADQLLSTNVLNLADRLVHERPQLIIGGFRIPGSRDPNELRAALDDPQLGQPNLILSVNNPALESALPEVGFTAIDRLELPEGHHATLWWRSRAELGSAPPGEAG